MFSLSSINLDFMKFRRKALIFSGILLLASILLLFTRGLNLGIDFVGGNLMQLKFSTAVEVSDLRDILSDVGQSQAVIQSYSNDGFMIRLNAQEETVRKEVLQAIREKYPDVELLRFEKVGPVVGEQLRKEAFIAVCMALLGILGYITVRFQFRFAVVSVLALMHDSLITLGVFSLTGMEVSLPFIAAILTIVGYSLNDTIVVLDRVRENWKNLKPWGIVKLLNVSLNQTLSRTMNTSITTFLPVMAFFLLGGPVLANFSFALLIGIVVGTYSSIYIAGSLLSEWYERSSSR